MVFSIGYSQEKIDVVYLKSGDIRKGVITENVPNDYIKIETADGSVFTIKYADIEKMTKEEKSAQQNIATREVKKGLMARTGDFGITACLWLGGEISLGDIPSRYWPDKEAGFLGRIFYDAYIMDKLAVGAYINISPVSVDNSNTGATMFEIGGSIKPRFPLADGAAVIKPGLNIGYRIYSSDSDVMDETKAMGLNVSVEVQFDAHQIFAPYFEIGFLSEPVGGNKATDVTFPPFIYFGGGIAF
jgi:hypothetical protein